MPVGETLIAPLNPSASPSSSVEIEYVLEEAE
jgi:hypothetical protein